ncbi:multidrug efflux SMR transporter [Paenibacillus sp. MWE-103]|uniref:Multidrug efflux SMR transporter n=1 Tax=Paenibacillus artemisiicola TaxID=1172618 RepID=A0ABS3WFP4_9BACL|nr:MULTISPECIES: multidrug efflux SMR transporter [Paenibacillus]MBO7747138.1 multidrug efflux SMR transporter [Paenibacillus artemisiicola]
MRGGNGMGWLLLGLAIALELSGTVSMKLSESFTRVVPSVLMFLFYGASFTLLNFALGYLEVSLVYAVWSGVGIVLIAIAGYFVFGEKLPMSSLLWIGVIVAGVIGLNISQNGH